MISEVVESQASTLRTWAEHWSREDLPEANEIAFLLARASRLMRGDPGAEMTPKVEALEAGLPGPEVVAVFEGD